MSVSHTGICSSNFYKVFLGTGNGLVFRLVTGYALSNFHHVHLSTCRPTSFHNFSDLPLKFNTSTNPWSGAYYMSKVQKGLDLGELHS